MRERDLCTGPTFVHGTTDLVVQSDLLEGICSWGRSKSRYNAMQGRKRVWARNANVMSGRDGLACSSRQPFFKWARSTSEN
jgi:hypothetical protein